MDKKDNEMVNQSIPRKVSRSIYLMISYHGACIRMLLVMSLSLRQYRICINWNSKSEFSFVQHLS
jgi:hypothetical protein